MRSHQKMLINLKNIKICSENRFVLFLFGLEKHDSRVVSPILNTSSPTSRDLFRPKSPSLILEEENTHYSKRKQVVSITALLITY